MAMKRWLIWLPLAVFAVLLWVVAAELVRPTDRTVRSHLVGKPLPEFNLPPSVSDKPGIAGTGRRYGGPRLVNIFASWCVPCIAEAPQLMALKQAGVAIDGIAIRDRREDVAEFLARHGDPYERIGDDRASAVQLALGSSGVPESFVIDARGRIVMQHVGDIRADDVPGILRALRDAR